MQNVDIGLDWHMQKMWENPVLGNRYSLRRWLRELQEHFDSWTQCNLRSEDYAARVGLGLVLLCSLPLLAVLGLQLHAALQAEAGGAAAVGLAVALPGIGVGLTRLVRMLAFLPTWIKMLRQLRCAQHNWRRSVSTQLYADQPSVTSMPENAAPKSLGAAWVPRPVAIAKTATS